MTDAWFSVFLAVLWCSILAAVAAAIGLCITGWTDGEDTRSTWEFRDGLDALGDATGFYEDDEDVDDIRAILEANEQPVITGRDSDV